LVARHRLRRDSLGLFVPAAREKHPGQDGSRVGRQGIELDRLLDHGHGIRRSALCPGEHTDAVPAAGLHVVWVDLEGLTKERVGALPVETVDPVAQPHCDVRLGHIGIDVPYVEARGAIRVATHAVEIEE